MVNVPEAACIDQRGRVCGRRSPPGRTKASVGWIARSTRAAGRGPHHGRGEGNLVNAVRDWALNGMVSEHALHVKRARAHVRAPTEDVAGRTSRSGWGST